MQIKTKLDCLPDKTIICLDAEFCDIGRIIEMTRLYYNSKDKLTIQVDRFNPYSYISNRLTNIHGINRNDLTECRSYKCARILTDNMPIRNYILGHSVSNDRRALKVSGERVNKFHWICTQKIMKHFFKVDHIGLKTAINDYIPDKIYLGNINQYKSYVDVINTFNLYNFLKEISFEKYGKNSTEFMCSISNGEINE